MVWSRGVDTKPLAPPRGPPGQSGDRGDMAEQAAPGPHLPSLGAHLLSVLCLPIPQPMKAPYPANPVVPMRRGKGGFIHPRDTVTGVWR